MSVRFRICLAAWAATVACSALCSPSQGDEVQVGNGWSIEITPAVRAPQASAPAVTASGGSEAAAASDASGDLAQQYRNIYDSIPFNRAEYDVNPSYRHDSAMEILTGNSRHQTIVEHSSRPIIPPQPTVPVLPYRYNNPRRGVNYYFYFPYWNYRGIY